MNFSGKALLLSTVLFSFVTPTTAAPVSYTFYGKATAISGATNPGVALNDAVSLTLSYDDDVTHLGYHGGDDYYEYEANHPVALSVTAGSWSYSWETSDATWSIIDDLCQMGLMMVYCRDEYYLGTSSGVNSGDINGYSWNRATLWSIAEDVFEQEFGSIGLIDGGASNGVPEILAWYRMSLAFRDGSTTVFSMTFAKSDPPEVPLPAAVWLFISGIAGLLGFARIKNTQES